MSDPTTPHIPVRTAIGATLRHGIVLATIVGIVLVSWAVSDPHNRVCQRADYIPACAEMGQCTYNHTTCEYDEVNR